MKPGVPLDGIEMLFTMYTIPTMPTVVQSCRVDIGDASLLARQAKRRHLEVSTLSSLYLREKALEEEYPGVGFRDSIGGREAYILGHRVAVWEVVEVRKEAKTIDRTARHFSWPPALVRCALAFAGAVAEETEKQRRAEVSG